MPGQPERGAQPLDRRCDHPEVLGDQRQLMSQRTPRRVERRPPRPARPPPAERVTGAARHGPVRREAAEVVDTREVDEVERAPQAVRPPAVAASPERPPVVQRVAPQLALVRVGVGRGAGHRVGAEQLGVRAVVDRPGGDVDRHVPDQPHPARRPVLAQRCPLAVEPHLVGDRAARPEPRPVVDPVRVALPEVELVGARHRRPRVGQQPAPRGEGGSRLVRRPVAVRRSQREHLPPGLPGVRQPVDEPVGVGAQAAAWQRCRMQLYAARAWEEHG